MTIKLTDAQALCLRAIASGRNVMVNNSPTVQALLKQGYIQPILTSAHSATAALTEKGRRFCGLT